MRYREAPPPPDLAPFVRCLWALEDARDADEPERVLPDGCAELIVHYGAPMARETDDGRLQSQPAAIVSGQLRTAARLRARGPIGMVGARFQPWAAGPFLREPLAGLTGRIVPLEALWAAEAGRLAERVGTATDDATRLAALAEHLRARRPGPDGTARALSAAHGWIAASRGAIAVEEIARRLGWSRRRLERRFAVAVGLPPKALCGIERFRHVVARLGAPAAARPRLADLAVDAGYADQAHLARAFRALAGVSVTRWLAERHALSDALTGRAPDGADRQPEATPVGTGTPGTSRRWPTAGAPSP
jgi:AraC-like DNA-binding protein